MEVTVTYHCSGIPFASHSEAVSAIKQFWSPVFTKANVEQKAMTRVAAAIPETPTYDERVLTFQEFCAIIDSRKEAASGPDGKGYQCWKAAGEWARKVLYRQYKSVVTLGTVAANFNYATLALIDKQVKPEHAFASGRTPAQHRCLSLSNCDQKIIAAAVIQPVSDHAEAVIPGNHYGGIRGRSPQECIMRSEAAAIRASTLNDDSAWALLDFTNAFPAISREFVIMCLSKAGVPENHIYAIELLWQGAWHQISYGGQRWTGFYVDGGLLQGSPASGTIFVFAMYAFDRWIVGVIGEDLSINCYLDDSNLICLNFSKHARRLGAAFAYLKCGTNLQLNVNKSVIIFLALDSASMEDALEDSRWSVMVKAECAKLLGILVGPNVGENMWPEVLRKHGRRVSNIRSLGLGLPSSAAFYNQAAFSTLAYVGAMVTPSQTHRSRVEADVQRLTAAPIWAFPKEVLHNLASCGLGPNIRHLAAVSAASMASLAARTDGLAELCESMCWRPGNEGPLLSHPFEQWRANCVAQTIFDTRIRVMTQCVDVDVTERKNMQARLTKSLSANVYNMCPRAGYLRRARHWSEQIPDSFGQYFFDIISATSKVTSPGFCLPIVKLLCNAVNTSTRYRNKATGGRIEDCIFCERHCGDDVWHLTVCPAMTGTISAFWGTCLPSTVSTSIPYFCLFDQPPAEQAQERIFFADLIVKAYQASRAVPTSRLRRAGVERLFEQRIRHWRRLDKKNGYLAIHNRLELRAGIAISRHRRMFADSQEHQNS